jgi:hypothetical protein
MGCLFALKMVRCSCDHGIFVWNLPNETCYIALETDDLLFISKTRTLFPRLKDALEKLYLTVCEGSVLKFLNLRIIQSPHGISFDQRNTYRLLFYMTISRIFRRIAFLANYTHFHWTLLSRSASMKLLL